jgi:hypothetical protein
MPFSDDLKLKVKRKAEFRCCLCHDLGIQVHHIIPEESQGPDTEDNAAPLCPSCHDKLGANPVKRKFIREARDYWYELCSERLAKDSRLLEEIADGIKGTASKNDLQNAMDKMINVIRSIPVEAQRQEMVAVELTFEEWTALVDNIEKIGKLQMTAREWSHIFPTWPNLPDVGHPSVFMNTRYAKMISAVLLPEYWPGVEVPDDEVQKATVFRAGRWCVTDNAIICLCPWPGGYGIRIDRLEEMNWLAHLLHKTWLYDPSDMIDAFEAAHAQLLPQETQAQHEAFIDAQTKTAFEEHKVPYLYPSRVLGRHIYLASRMTDGERKVS